MTIHPVIRENVHTGAIGRYVHALNTETRATLCGMSVYTETPSVQMSVEPAGTRVTCLRCRSVMGDDPRDDLRGIGLPDPSDFPDPVLEP